MRGMKARGCRRTNPSIIKNRLKPGGVAGDLHATPLRSARAAPLLRERTPHEGIAVVGGGESAAAVVGAA